jgi:3-deoxy-D-manno-octulosonic-acid transferase
MGLLYRLLYPLALLLAGPVLLVLRGRHYLPTLAGRTTLELPDPPVAPLWIHAVSVGESMVASTLARALPAATPLLVTTITPTGQERAKQLLGDRATIAYLPFDLGWAVERFLRRARPRALVLVEGDYWPQLLGAARRRRVPIAVVNGRVGDRTHRRLASRPRLSRWLLGPVDRFGVQSDVDRRRLEAMGVEPSRVAVTGNLKYEAPAPSRRPELEARLRALAAGRPLLVAGSTMPGEEEVVLSAFGSLGAPALLVLAPRHPERWPEVAALLAAAGRPFVRRSALDGSNGSPGADIVLLDTLGELADVYRYATAAFVGGTLVATGGHNPLEPARFGVPVAVGPSMTNFRDMAAQFDRSGAWARVGDASDLAATWRSWLAEPAAARALGARARRLVEDNRGALRRTLDLIEPLL